jgi:hypothetical protein
MARAKATKGKCAFCGQEIAKVSAAKHGATCAPWQAAIAESEGSKRKSETLCHPLTLLIRNVPPVYECQECQQPAVRLCMECVYEDGAEGTLCERHAENHPHEEYGEPMPLVNSPRMGLCGYCGPAEPPY